MCLAGWDDARPFTGACRIASGLAQGSGIELALLNLDIRRRFGGPRLGGRKSAGGSARRFAAACPGSSEQARRVLRVAPPGAVVRVRLVETDDTAGAVASHVSLLWVCRSLPGSAEKTALRITQTPRVQKILHRVGNPRRRRGADHGVGPVSSTVELAAGADRAAREPIRNIRNVVVLASLTASTPHPPAGREGACTPSPRP